MSGLIQLVSQHALHLLSTQFQLPGNGLDCFSGRILKYLRMFIVQHELQLQASCPD